MDIEVFNQRLRALIREMADVPEDIPSRSASLTERLDKLGKSLLNLRICIKYLMFDLEATRRERDYLRAMLDNPPRQD